MIRKYCATCKTIENLLPSPYTKVMNTDGTIRHAGYLCRSCQARRQRAYYLTPRGKLTVRKHIKKYAEKNPERVKAWSKAQRIAKQPCAVCGDNRSQRHHPKIDKPLEVIFLCALHHKQAESTITKRSFYGS